MFARLATLTLAATLVSSQAFASGEFEYTISEPTTAVTTYGTTTYQGNVGTTQGNLDVYQVQTPITDGTQGSIDGLVYDSEPYFPNGTPTTVETYTSQPAYTAPSYGATDVYGQPITQESDASWK